MSTKIYIDWEDNDVLWNDEIREWENVYYIIYDLGGARDPREWCDHPFDNYDNECKVDGMKTKIKVRKSWGLLNPCTRKINSVKVYSRKNKWGNRLDGE